MSLNSCKFFWLAAAVTLCVSPGNVWASALYPFQNNQVLVDYWTGTGSNEAIIVVDWNDTNGPYVTESHAFGYRWNGTTNLQQALLDIDAAGALDLVGVAANFVNYADYDQTLIDGDNHSNQSPMDYNGWVWIGWTDDFGSNWTGNTGTLDQETLVNGRINALNLNPDDWTNSNLTIPIPEPASAMLLGLGSLLMLRRRSQA